MTARDWVLIAASIFTGGGIWTALSSVLSWRQMGPQTKATTTKLAAEAHQIDIDTQEKLMDQVDRLLERVENQDAKISHLEDVIATQGEQIAKLQQRNRDLGASMRAAVVELLTWIKRALAVMTPDQQESVGLPPDYNHLVQQPERS